MKKVTVERVSRILCLIHQTPNKSVQRAALWKRLMDLKSSIS